MYHRFTIPFVSLTLLISMSSLLFFRFFRSGSIGFQASRQLSHQPHLRANAQNDFHISIFSDLHYGEEESGWGIDQDTKSTRVMNSVLDREKPDLVIINGDLITGENTFLHNSTKYVDMIVEPMVSRGIPWASTYGNHDTQFNLSREGIFLEESKYNLSYTGHSVLVVPGVTNYYLPIYPASKTSDVKPVAILWFFDSQGGFPFQGLGKPDSIPHWVSQATVDWFISSRESIQSRWGELPSLAFVHIPPTVFLAVQRNLLPNIGDKSRHFPGLNDDVPLDSEGDGWQDVPFMQALVDTPKLHSIYSGHDHGDSWCANWPEQKDVTRGVSQPHLCFCKHTGYGGYGSWNRGSRSLRLSFPRDGRMEVETWVRMEDGRVVQRVSLNTTYGIDVYSGDDGE